MNFYIARRCDDRVSESPKLAAHEPVVPHRAGSNGDIKPFIDHVNDTVGEVEVEKDIGIFPHEICEHGHHQHPAERQTYADPAAWIRLGIQKLSPDAIVVRLNAPANVKEEPAFVGQGHASGRTVKQPDTEFIFEPTDGFSNGRAGDAQSLRRKNEATAISGLNKDVDRVELVHVDPIQELSSDV